MEVGDANQKNMNMIHLKIYSMFAGDKGFAIK